MNAKEAVRTAKNRITELYADEDIQHIGLEEVIFDDTLSAWKVTIGFFRAWDKRTTPLGGLAAISGDRNPDRKRRSFKAVRIDNETGDVNAMTYRSLPAAE